MYGEAGVSYAGRTHTALVLLAFVSNLLGTWIMALRIASHWLGWACGNARRCQSITSKLVVYAPKDDSAERDI